VLALDALLAARTAVYRAASPWERLARRMRGASELPPLWLRRHVGPPGRFVSAAQETMQLLDQLCLFDGVRSVLDVGCGCGSMVPHFLGRLGAEARYLGFDVHAPSIHWCQSHFAGDPRAQFFHADLDSPYSASAGPAATRRYPFPAANGSVDLVLAKSVFTHLLEEELVHYLSEVRRVLAPAGRAFVTLFLFDDAAGTAPEAFPYPARAGATVRWRRRTRPQAAVAYGRAHLMRLLATSGLELDELIAGFWPGTAATPTGQDQLVLRRVEG